MDRLGQESTCRVARIYIGIDDKTELVLVLHLNAIERLTVNIVRLTPHVE